MPSVNEDPTTQTTPQKPLTTPALQPRSTILPRTGQKVTVLPITQGPSGIPSSLLKFLTAEFNAEVERGCTYPMDKVMNPEEFGGFWFGLFGAIAVLDDEDYEDGNANGNTNTNGLREDRDWEKSCLGTFYVKPNYPGRCSHISNAGFLTTTASRGKGVGSIMGEAYLDYAPKLGYKYSVFNLVFANNTASIKTWNKLGFSVIGRVPACGKLTNSEELVDALIYGRELGR